VAVFVCCVCAVLFVLCIWGHGAFILVYRCVCTAEYVLRQVGVQSGWLMR
jgi:hypothetical protein